MAHAQFNVGLKVILKNEQGEILALEAHSNGPMAGYYDLPGGRIDDNEVGVSFLEIIKREITEELGEVEYTLDSRPAISLSWIWPNGQPMTFVYYYADYKSGDIVISDEHLSSKWVPMSKDNLDSYFTTYHRAALEQLLNQA